MQDDELRASLERLYERQWRSLVHLKTLYKETGLIPGYAGNVIEARGDALLAKMNKLKLNLFG